MYTLFARVQALDAMRVAFKEHIKKTGLALVLDEEKVCAVLAHCPAPCSRHPGLCGTPKLPSWALALSQSQASLSHGRLRGLALLEQRFRQSVGVDANIVRMRPASCHAVTFFSASAGGLCNDPHQDDLETMLQKKTHTSCSHQYIEEESFLVEAVCTV